METTNAGKPMTADEAREQSRAERKANPEVVAKMLAYYRRAIDQESRAGNFSAPHYPADRLENRVTRHDLAEVQDALTDLGYHLDARGVHWGSDHDDTNNDWGGILARAINTQFVRRGAAGPVKHYATAMIEHAPEGDGLNPGD